MEEIQKLIAFVQESPEYISSDLVQIRACYASFALNHKNESKDIQKLYEYACKHKDNIVKEIMEKYFEVERR